MAVNAVVRKLGGHQNAVRWVANDYTGATALTIGTNKREWIVPAKLRLRGIYLNSGTAGTVSGSDIVDINRNGTTIFTTQANRPTLGFGDTGFFTIAGAGPDGGVMFDEGDILAYDVDAVCGGVGSARFTVALVFTMP